jgi:hypothetical protein
VRLAAQRTLRITKFVSTAGAAVGVITGCCLLFIDLGASERQRQAAELKVRIARSARTPRGLESKRVGGDACRRMAMVYSDAKAANRKIVGFSGGDGSRGRFATPTD